jgi:hypothetical protein
MVSRFTPATRKRVRARIALAGPSGAGKTLTGLKLLYRLTGAVTIADGRRGSRWSTPNVTPPTGTPPTRTFPGWTT